MSDNSHNLKKTPLRNSNLANKPFRSPFNTNSISSIRENNTIRNSTSEELEAQLQWGNSIKRRKLNVDEHESSDSTRSFGRDLLALEQRIKNKRSEIESLKSQLACRKKHNVEDLKVEINKWRRALQRALLKYHMDCQQINDGERILNMAHILSMLGIPESVVNFPKNIENF